MSFFKPLLLTSTLTVGGIYLNGCSSDREITGFKSQQASTAKIASDATVKPGTDASTQDSIPKSVPVGTGDCLSDWGISFKHGLSIDACASAAVDANQTCDCKSVNCENGVADFSGYRFAVCQKRAADTCDSPAGGVIKLGEKKFYSKFVLTSADKAASKTCESFVGNLTCRAGGILEGEKELFRYDKCDEGAKLECKIPWGGIAIQGEIIPAFESATVAFDQSCKAEERICQSNGTFSGSFTNQNCVKASVDPVLQKPTIAFSTTSLNFAPAPVTQLVAASTNSGTTLSFSGGSGGVCSITSDGTLTTSGAGSCAISVTSAAGNGYEAGSKSTNITINQIQPLLVFNLNNMIVGDATGQLFNVLYNGVLTSAINGSLKGDYSFTEDTIGVCETFIIGSSGTPKLLAKSAGECRITVSFAARGGYLAASKTASAQVAAAKASCIDPLGRTFADGTSVDLYLYPSHCNCESVKYAVSCYDGTLSRVPSGATNRNASCSNSCSGSTASFINPTATTAGGTITTYVRPEQASADAICREKFAQNAYALSFDSTGPSVCYNYYMFVYQEWGNCSVGNTIGNITCKR